MRATRGVFAAALALSAVACASEPTPASPAISVASTTAAPAASVASASASSSVTSATQQASSVAVTTVPATTTAPDAVVPEGFDRVAAQFTMADGTVCDVCLWLAATGEQRQRGLMRVTDLGDADGMAFRYDSPNTGSFWMKNTVLPLSIAFYDVDGAYLDAFDMEPCAADPCPTYRTPSDFLVAIETDRGGLADLGITPDSTLRLTDLPCE